MLKDKLHRIWVQIHNYTESNVLTHCQMPGGDNVLLSDINKGKNQYLKIIKKKNLNIAGLRTSIALNLGNGIFIVRIDICSDKPRALWIGGNSSFFHLFLTLYYAIFHRRSVENLLLNGLKRITKG